MLIYKAAYTYCPDGIHAQVLDFPGVITCGKRINETRKLLAGALEDMAETYLEMGKPLPRPNAELRDSEADFDEPIHLILKASTKVELRPAAAA